MSTPKPDTRLLHSTALEKRFPDLAFLRNGGSYVAVTTPAANLTVDDFALLNSSAPSFTPPSQFGLRTGFGFAEEPEALEIEIAVGSGVVGYTHKWQYKDGAGFADFGDLAGVTDGTVNYTATGSCVVTWTPPGDWVTDSGLYQIQSLTTAYTSAGTIPRGSWVYGHYTVAVDRSQYDTPLTASGGAYYEDPSPRCALDGSGMGRSVELSVELDTSVSGTLVEFGADAGDPNYAITVTAGGTIVFVHDGGTLISLAAPDVSGTAKTYVIGYNTEPNGATTGGGDALRSEATVYSVDDGTIATGVITHDVLPLTAGSGVAVGGSWDGSAMSDVFDGTINAVRISSRYHTRTEVREHWVAQSAAADVDGVEAIEAPVLPADLAEPGSIVGPQYQAGAASLAVGRNRHRLVGPVVQFLDANLVFYESPLSGVTGLDATRVRALPGGYETHLGWLWRRSIVRHAEWLLGRIQWGTLDLGGGAVAASVRLYSASQPPHLAQPDETSYVTLSRTDDDAGAGVVAEFAPLRVQRGEDGRSWLWLGISLGASDRAYIRELTIQSLTRQALDVPAPPPQWGP